MAIHSQNSLDKRKAELQADIDRLLGLLQGNRLESAEAKHYRVVNGVRVNGNDIALAADKAIATARAIKKEFGKE